MKKTFTLLCTICLALSYISPASALTKIVVFGDSLSDLGFQDHLGPLIGESPLWTSPGGKTWPFYLSHDLKLPTITVNNSTAPNKKNMFVSTFGLGDDYAAGGALTEGTGLGSSSYSPPSIYQQISNYLEKHATDNKSQTLYVLWGGANDMLAGLSSSDPGTAVMTAAKKAADNIDYYAELLIDHCASNVIVINLPN